MAEHENIHFYILFKQMYHSETANKYMIMVLDRRLFWTEK